MIRSNSNSSPGRPREFEIDEAVELAMQVFWSRGYHNTSLIDLIEGTGLSRGSLYKAFGDKRGLFIAALKCYITMANKRLSLTLRKTIPAKVAIREMLMDFAELSCGMEGKRGCLLLTTTIEMVVYDAEIADYVQDLYERMRHGYTSAIQCGQKAGEISMLIDAQATAGLMICITQGMRVQGKVGVTKGEIVAIVDAAMKLLE